MTDAASLSAMNHSEYVDLKGISIKSLGLAAKNSYVLVDAVKIRDGELINEHSGLIGWFGEGYLHSVRIGPRTMPGRDARVNFIEVSGWSPDGHP